MAGPPTLAVHISLTLKPKSVYSNLAEELLLLLQFLFAPCERTPARAPARADPRQRFGQAVGALYTRDGGGTHRPCLDPPGGAPVPRAAVAPASRGMSTQGGGKRHGEAA